MTEAQPKTRDFHLGDVLSITTGHLVSNRHMEGAYDILNWMTSSSLQTLQLPLASEACKPRILEQHPWLDDPEISVMAIGELILMLDTDLGKHEKELLVTGWLSKLTTTYGETLPIAPIPHCKQADME